MSAAVKTRRPITDSAPQSGQSSKIKVFTEPGAINEHGDYIWWLHVWRAGEKEFTTNIYPWPFDEQGKGMPVIDDEVLLAFMNVTAMRNWPGGWPSFSLYPMARSHHSGHFYWKLAPGMGKQWMLNDRYPAYRIPEVFLASIRNR